MRFTSRKDMIVGLALASGLLCFQLGAFFGPNPPRRFYDDLMAAPVPPAKAAPPTIVASPFDPAAPAPVTATFIDRPATIQAVRLAKSGIRTRVEIALGPGAAAPRLAMLAKSRRPMLAVTGLDTLGAERGDGMGLVNRWELTEGKGGAQLNLPLTEPATVERAFLTNESGDDRRLVLDLIRACPALS